MYNFALLSKKTIRGPIHSRFQDALVSRVNAKKLYVCRGPLRILSSWGDYLRVLKFYVLIMTIRMLEKRGDFIQERTLFKELWYV